MKLTKMIPVILMASGLTCINSAGADSSPVKWKAIGPGVSGASMAAAISPHDPKIMLTGTDMGALFRTEDGGKSWIILGSDTTGDNPGYRGAWNALFDPKHKNIVWAASEHGVFKSTDAGISWKRMTRAIGGTNLSFQGLAIDAENSDIVYICQGWTPMGIKRWLEGRVWRTLDGGNSWTELTSPTNKKKPTTFTDLVIDPNSTRTEEGFQRLFICGLSGLFKSDDAGKSWTSLAGAMPASAGVNPRFGNLWLISESGKTSIMVTVVPVFAADKKDVYGGIYRSDDLGKSWTACNNNLENAFKRSAPYNKNDMNLFPIYLRGTAANSNRLYAGIHPEGIFRSDDQGKTWIKTMIPNQRWEKIVTAAGETQYLRSSTKGGNFTNSYSYATDGLHSIATCAANPDMLLYTDMGSVGATMDGGKTWSDILFDFVDAYDPGRFNAVLPTIFTNRIKSRGPQIIEAADLTVDPFNPQIIYAAYHDHGFRVSRDGGESWEAPSRGIETYADVTGARSVTCDPAVKGRVYFTSWGPQGRAFVSEDHGLTLKNISIANPDKTLIKNKGEHTGIVIDPRSPLEKRILYMATDKGFFKSANGGKTWENVTPAIMENADNVKVLVLAPGNPDTMYAGTSPVAGKMTNAGLFKSTDSGKTWEKIMPEKIGGVWALSICRSKPEIMYLVANAPGKQGNWIGSTLWKSTDSGKSWKQLLNGFYQACAVNPYNPDWVYTGFKMFDINKSDAKYLRSRDGGNTWEDIRRDIPINGDLQKIVVDEKDPRKVFYLDFFTIYKGFDVTAPVK